MNRVIRTTQAINGRIYQVTYTYKPLPKEQAEYHAEQILQIIREALQKENARASPI